ncbi:nodulation protein NfeD [Oceanobacillus piezotolerans]|uniref:Nodulation protein NfeD n=1 Tax=Oceanobacillus piezotolerans TaxID=2448030 RepID=A0A498DDE9_9BACI|nr:NfeD family protein [Oceanobacillus piezotolerans]RLL48066.1 nodulation protein NfeD [Oceanobacillus piezotolerans]
MEIFELAWIGLIITSLGTLFLIGEVLVNARGVFALLGIGFMSVYFGAYVETDSFIIMLILYFIGLFLIILDGKVINDGTFATIGFVIMLIAVAIAAPDFTSGLYSVLGVLIGTGASFIFPKVFKKRQMWTKLALKDQLTSEAGYNSMNMEYGKLLNKKGRTLTDLRPVGTIRIDGKDYSAISNGQWIQKNTIVSVVQVDGTKILVEIIDEK